MQKEKTILLLAFVLVTVWTVAAFATASPKYQLNDPKRLLEQYRYAGGGDEWDGVAVQPRVWGEEVAVGAAAPANPSPGYQMGTTWYDYQHNGSTGRQVDWGGDAALTRRGVQVSWMKAPSASLGLGRKVYWNKIPFDPTGGGFSTITLANGDTLTVRNLDISNIGSVNGTDVASALNRAGYTTYRNITASWYDSATTLGRGSGRGVVFCHDAPDTAGLPLFHVAAVDKAPYSGIFQVTPSPQPPGVDPALGNEVIWPHGTVDICGGDTVVHVVARGSSTDIYDPIWYWRGIVDAAGNGVTTWDSLIFMDTVATISMVVEQDPNSDEVAIVYTKTINMDYVGGTAQSYNDVIVRKSTNCGLTWSSRIYATDQDTLAEGWFPYTDLDAAYDEDGTLHVLYNARRYYDDDGDGENTLFNIPVGMFHWNDVRNTSRAIQVTDWQNDCNDEGGPFLMGSWNLLLAKPSITVKPMGKGWNPGAEILYAIWSQAGPTNAADGGVEDCARQFDSLTVGGYVNNEIFVSASSDDGLTWDRPRNITGSESPDCLANDCNSEHWVTAADRCDSAMYLSFVADTHAGGIVQEEGGWTESPYHVYAPASRNPIPSPRIAVTPTDFVERHVLPGADDSVAITVQNLGNATLTYNIDVQSDNGGLSHVVVRDPDERGSSVSGSIAAAGADLTIYLIYDGVSLADPSEHDWRVEVTSNDVENDPNANPPGSPIDLNLNVFVSTVWYTCVDSTLSTGSHDLAVGSCLEIGNQGGEGGLYNTTTEREFLFDASPVVAWNDMGTKTVYRDIFWNNLQDRSRDSNRAFRAQSEITVNRADVVNGHPAQTATGKAYSTDSLLELQYHVTTFTGDTSLQYGAIMKYTMTRAPGVTDVFTGLHIGAAADLDMDSMSASNDGIASSTLEYVGGFGGWTSDDDVPIYTAQPQFTSAIFHMPLDPTCDNMAQGGQVLDNVDYIYPENAYNTDTLYDWMANVIGWGSNTQQQDTITDINVVMGILKNQTLASAADTIEFAFGIVVSDGGSAHLLAKMAALRQAYNDSCLSCPIVVSGDVNESGALTAADIIYMVQHVFKGGPPPEPCAANGDVNCSGANTAADIIYLVQHVFKGGPAPCDICNTPGAMTCVPNP